MQIEKFTLPNGRDEYVRTSSYYDETKPAAYLIEYSCGQYDTYVNGPVKVCYKLDDAIAFVTKHYEWKDEIERLAIKNLYNNFSEYNVDIEEDPDFPNVEQYPFNKLEQDWKDYCFDKMFPGKSWEDVNSEQEEAYFDVTENEDEFVKWLVSEKNISEDVARASIIYNTSDEYSVYATDYSIVKINFE